MNKKEFLNDLAILLNKHNIALSYIPDLSTIGLAIIDLKKDIEWTAFVFNDHNNKEVFEGDIKILAKEINNENS